MNKIYKKLENHLNYAFKKQHKGHQMHMLLKKHILMENEAKGEYQRDSHGIGVND